MLLTEIIAFSSEYRVKHIITLCGESAGGFSIRVGDTYNKHSDWNNEFSNVWAWVESYMIRPLQTRQNHLHILGTGWVGPGAALDPVKSEESASLTAIPRSSSSQTNRRVLYSRDPIKKNCKVLLLYLYIPCLSNGILLALSSLVLTLSSQIVSFTFTAILSNTCTEQIIQEYMWTLRRVGGTLQPTGILTDAEDRTLFVVTSV